MEIVEQAIDAGVDVIGASSQAGGHNLLVPRVLELLKERNAEDIKVICGGVIPPIDYPALEEAGVCAIFGPGTHIPDAAQTLIDLLKENLHR